VEVKVRFKVRFKFGLWLGLNLGFNFSSTLFLILYIVFQPKFFLVSGLLLHFDLSPIFKVISFLPITYYLVARPITLLVSVSGRYLFLINRGPMACLGHRQSVALPQLAHALLQLHAEVVPSCLLMRTCRRSNKNPVFKFWTHEFVRCAPEIEKLVCVFLCYSFVFQLYSSIESITK
jgi:hypothetical protein